MTDSAKDLPLTIPALWKRHVAERGDELVVIGDDESLTYREADRRSRRLARGLIAAGAGKGSHVALLFPNSPNFLVAMIAAARIGAVVLPISTLSTAEELGWLLHNSDSAFLLATRAFRSQDFEKLLPSSVPGLDLTKEPPLSLAAFPWLRHIWFAGNPPEGQHPGWSIAALEDLGDTVEEELLEAAEERVTAANPFVIIHTSGSTSKPKGVIHVHGTMIRHLANTNEIRELRAEDILFATSPWFWVAGFSFALVGVLVAGATIACTNETDPPRFLDFIERVRPTMSNGYAPAMARYAADPSFPSRDFSTMRRGNLHPIMPADVRPSDPDLRHNIYGMTEVGGGLTMSANETDQPEHRRGSLGQLLPDFEARIVDPETLEDCGPDQPGELWLRGPLMMQGYYNRPRHEIFQPDGWWRSGDLCRIDKDGFFYIEGRMGDMIKTAGANVAPKEVEAALRSITGAPQCIVFGLPDPERGEIVVAVIVTEGNVDAAAIIESAKKKLSSFKVPRRVIAIPESELPMMSSGKIDMPALKARVGEQEAV